MSRTLGRYELVELLAQGGMGEVWLARVSGEAFEKACIVKTVLPALVKDRQFVERFLHEGKLLVHLSHSNIVHVYEMRQEDGVLYMAMEYVSGVDVWRLMAQLEQSQELAPIPVALFIAWQAAEGLAYAHHLEAPDGSSLAIVHRDVSPQNVMVTYGGEVKVIDFGIARSAARSHSTQAATVLGKLGYMSPEQANAGEVDARADQFSLAVVLWELLTGKRYVGAATTNEMMVAMTRPPLQPLPPLRIEVDAALDAVVQKALSPVPADRYPTIDDFGRALVGELTRLGGPPSKRQVGEWVKLKCSEAWEANQRLLSRLSTSEGRTDAPAPLPLEVLAPTLAKEKPGAAPALTPLTPAPAGGDQPTTGRSSAAPLIAALAVLVLAGSVGAWWLTHQPGAVPAPVKPPSPVAVEPARDAAVEPVATAQPLADAGAAPAAAVEPSPPPPAQPKMQASLQWVATPKRAVRVKNTGPAAISGCQLTVPGQRRVELKSLAPGLEREFVLGQFKPDRSAPSLSNEVRLDCAQGSVSGRAQ